MVELQYLSHTITVLTLVGDIKNMSKPIEVLEDNDDIRNVYHNFVEVEELETCVDNV